MSVNVATVDSPQWGVLSAVGRYSPCGRGTSGFTGVVNNRMWFFAVPISTMLTIDRLGLRHTSAAGSAGSVWRLGIYSASNTTRMPTTLVTSGSVSAESTGWKEITVNQVLYPGLHWFATVLQATGGLVGANIPNGLYYTTPQVNGLDDTPAGTNVGVLFQDSVTGALPATATPSGSQNVNNAAMPWFRRSA